jgi:hypothetical protein
MRPSFSRRFRRELGFLRRQFLQDDLRPFADVLSANLVGRALAAIGTAWYDRIYTPLVTLWLFLGRALSPYLISATPPPGCNRSGNLLPPSLRWRHGCQIGFGCHRRSPVENWVGGRY